MEDRYEEMMSKIIDKCEEFFGIVAADLRGKHLDSVQVACFCFCPSC